MCGAEVAVVGRTTQHYEPVFTREKVEGLLMALENIANSKPSFDREPFANHFRERAREALEKFRSGK
jgi:uncharacterized protein (DUF39 family)